MRFVTILLCAAGVAFDQRLTGELRLHVKDPVGAGVEASGTLRSLTTAIHRTFRTDPSGFHILSALPFGPYRLAIARPGFSTKTVLLESDTLLNPNAAGAAQYLGLIRSTTVQAQCRAALSSIR